MMIISHSKITEFYKQEGPKINGTADVERGRNCEDLKKAVQGQL